MDPLKKVNFKSNLESKSAANDLVHHGKKFARALYRDGAHQVDNAEEQVKELSDDLAHKVQKNPLTAVLVATGIGFLLSFLFRK